ncbi:MAG: heparan-alpha-glucosaminide N-acetyltransferase domain-containing protein [Sphingomicrobium sp.]
MTTVNAAPASATPVSWPLSPADAVKARTRLMSIDALRGLVMAFMLVDHIRETWFLHAQLTDPVDATMVDPALFFTRLLSTFCAPVFVVLTGLSAWLYGQSHSKEETALFLLKRGLFLMVLEVTLVGSAWSTVGFLPPTVWLQVIWAIGVSMIALAALLHLPRAWQLAVGLLIVCGHNLLDPIVLTPDSPWFVPWAMIHQREAIALANGYTVKTSYPVLAWIGVILLGYWAGPWFAKGTDSEARIRRLFLLGAGMLGAFLILRGLNFYGDKPWFVVPGNGLRTVMSFLATTKYPPSLLFLLPTVGFGALMLALFEKHQSSKLIPPLSVLGGAPMFFYLLHLYTLKALYWTAFSIYGPTKGAVFGVDSIGWVWLWWVLLIVPLYFPTKWFADLKQRRRDIWWLKYL